MPDRDGSDTHSYPERQPRRYSSKGSEIDNHVIEDADQKHCNQHCDGWLFRLGRGFALPAAGSWLSSSIQLTGLTELEALGRPAASAQSLALGKSIELAAEELDRIKALGGSVIPLDHPSYPERRHAIYDPPIVLYLKGNIEVLSTYGLAVVGTRYPTPYGTRTRGLAIIRGMARGIDTAAHRGALSSKQENTTTRVIARCALEQGKDVYAVPDNLNQQAVFGS